MTATQQFFRRLNQQRRIRVTLMNAEKAREKQAAERKEPMQYRHGDVFLRRVDALPDEAQQAEKDGADVVLAYGEVTGHAHRIKERTVVMWSAGDQRYITVEKPSDLTHEEHGTITIPPGTYEVIQQREYDYLAEMPRAVAD